MLLPNTINAIQLITPSENFQLVLNELPFPERKDNELLIKVDYVALNTCDAKLAQRGFAHWQYPHTLGLDAVGTVVDAPKGAIPRIGDRVMWHADISQQGMLANYVAVPNFAVSTLPNTIASEVAVTLPSSGMTALFALEKLKLVEGNNLFIDAGAGNIGHFAIQLAKQQGINVYTTAQKSKHAYLKKLGADHVFDYTSNNLKTQLQQEVGSALFDGIIDTLGGKNTVQNIELLQFCGSIACLNSLPTLSDNLLFSKAPVINIISLAGAWLTRSLCAQQYMSFKGDYLMQRVADKSLLPPKIIPVEFSPEAITLALNKQLTGNILGKQVVKIV